MEVKPRAIKGSMAAEKIDGAKEVSDRPPTERDDLKTTRFLAAASKAHISKDDAAGEAEAKLEEQNDALDAMERAANTNDPSAMAEAEQAGNAFITALDERVTKNTADLVQLSGTRRQVAALFGATNQTHINVSRLRAHLCANGLVPPDPNTMFDRKSWTLYLGKARSSVRLIPLLGLLAFAKRLYITRAKFDPSGTISDRAIDWIAQPGPEMQYVDSADPTLGVRMGPMRPVGYFADQAAYDAAAALVDNRISRSLYSANFGDPLRFNAKDGAGFVVRYRIWIDASAQPFGPGPRPDAEGWLAMPLLAMQYIEVSVPGRDVATTHEATLAKVLPWGTIAANHRPAVWVEVERVAQGRMSVSWLAPLLTALQAWATGGGDLTKLAAVFAPDLVELFAGSSDNPIHALIGKKVNLLSAPSQTESVSYTLI